MSRPSLRTAFKKCRSIEDTDQKLGYRFGAFQALGGTASLVSMLLLLACGANPVAPDAGSPDAGVSADGGLDLTLIEATVQPSKASAAADGQDRVELRVTLRRRGTGGAGSLGIPGVVIVFSGGGAGVAITQPTAATDPEGVATGFVVSSSLGEKVIKIGRAHV